MQIKRMLDAISVAGSSDVDIHVLARHFTPAKYPRGTGLFRKGERGDSAYYVVAGEVEFPEVGARCRAGDLFGEVAMFSPDNVRTASAVCASDVELYRIDEHAIVTASYQDPALAFSLLRLVTRRLLENCARLEREVARLQATALRPSA
jgi:CRP-like cAMP-binding protein